EAAEAVEDLFAQVLRLCAGWGMGELGVVALDGVKIASNASIRRVSREPCKSEASSVLNLF
ncbi:hypothetical protein, partial [Nocardia nova]|uniref:hypothetical protein n=1 Tax=Nocardia nova TaxID=37330 RepID=UPI001E46AAA9